MWVLILFYLISVPSISQKCALQRLYGERCLFDKLAERLVLTFVFLESYIDHSFILPFFNTAKALDPAEAAKMLRKVGCFFLTIFDVVTL